MLRYIIRRVLMLVPILIVVAVAAFTLLHLTPGNPAAVMLGPQASTEQIDELTRQLGLDRPLLVQFFNWASGVLRGNLGTSYTLQRPVSELIWDAIPVTISLTVLSLAVAVALGFPAGVYAAVYRNSVYDQILMSTATLGAAVPNFWLAMLMIIGFSVRLRWLPVQGYTDLADGFIDWLRHLALPALSVGFVQAAVIARMSRSSMLDVLREDYIRTAQSKGVPDTRVVFVHGLRNAAVPILTVLGLTFASLLGGVVIIETVFGLPGLGRLMINSLSRRDYPVIQGVLLCMALVCTVVNLVVDILYALVDPRIRYE